MPAGGLSVPSCSEPGRSYRVSLAGEGRCDCPDWRRRKEPCKHIYAALVWAAKGSRAQVPAGRQAAKGSPLSTTVSPSACSISTTRPVTVSSTLRATDVVRMGRIDLTLQGRPGHHPRGEVRLDWVSQLYCLDAIRRNATVVLP